MKKIIIGLSTFLIFSTPICFATPNGPSKNEATVPYYDSGFSFGLASCPPEPDTDTPELDRLQISNVSYGYIGWGPWLWFIPVTRT